MRPDRARRGAGGGSGDAIPRRPPPRRARDSSWRGEVRSTSGTRRLSLMASTLFHGGRIHVRSGVSADALLARDGRVAAVGRVADVTRDAGKAERVDLRGGLMTPGWFDAHVHFMWWGFQMAEIDLREKKTIDEAVEAIGRRIRELAPGEWLTGGRFDKNKWGRWPTAADLDRVTGDRPAVLRSRDGHSRWLNTAALRAAKIGKDTVAPEGGVIFRDAAGAPTGILQERANELADRATPLATDADCDAATARAQQEALKRGVTGVESLEAASSYAALRRAHDRGALDAVAPTRVTSPALRQRLEHIQLVRAEDLGRFGALGVIASMQPIHCTSDRDLADRYWGPRRTPRAYPWRTLLDRRAVLAFGSDAPVEPIDPLLGIHAAITRRRPSDREAWFPAERLTLDEALHAYTAGAAYSTGREREWGTLEVGMRCDATVVDRDLAMLTADEVLAARVSATITDGVVRYADGLA